MFPFLIIRLILALINLSFPSPAYAQEPPTPLIQITEVYSAPASGASEWFELYNPGLEAVDLEGWQVFDQLTNPSLIYEISNAEERWLLPGQHRVFTLTSAKLNNSADGVTVIDSCQTQVDQMSYNQPASSTLSWSLYNTTWVLAPPSPGEATPTLPPSPTPTPTQSPTPSPTPTPPPTATPTPSPSPTPNILTENYIAEHLLLSEVMSCPSTGNKEWIELFWNADETVSLNNWVLRDSTATIFTFTSTLVAPNTFYVAELPSARLNNSGDTIRLVSPSGNFTWNYNIPICTQTTSFILDGDQLIHSHTSSPGYENPKITQITPDLNSENTPASSSSATISSNHLPTPFNSLESPTHHSQTIAYPGKIPQFNVHQLQFPTHDLSDLVTTSQDVPNPTLALLSGILGGLLIAAPNGTAVILHAQKLGLINLQNPFV